MIKPPLTTKPQHCVHNIAVSLPLMLHGTVYVLPWHKLSRSCWLDAFTKKHIVVQSQAPMAPAATCSCMRIHKYVAVGETKDDCDVTVCTVTIITLPTVACFCAGSRAAGAQAASCSKTRQRSCMVAFLMREKHAGCIEIGSVTATSRLLLPLDCDFCKDVTQRHLSSLQQVCTSHIEHSLRAHTHTHTHKWCYTKRSLTNAQQNACNTGMHVF
jgi:hypothetical protein